MSESKHLVAITACPSGVAHTYLAAENLQLAAMGLGYSMDVETHGQIGVENRLSEDAIERADAVVIAADKSIDLSRFGGKRIVVASAADGIHHAGDLIERALAAEPTGVRATGGAARPSASPSGRRSAGQIIYGNLMNGVSHMIPFVVVGGLFFAIALSMSGQAGVPEEGLAATIWAVGALGMSMMGPILSGYIAYAIADRPGLAPGVICGLLAANHPEIYNSEASAGFLGALITGFAAGYVALGIKKLPTHRFIAPIMPIIIIPVLTTLIVAGFFIFVLGGPIGALYVGLTSWLRGMTGAGVIVLGIILGLLTGFDLGGPVNKVAFVTTGALIADGFFVPGAMNGVAVAVPPIGLAIATFVARKYFTDAERQNGIAAAIMGCFGITEGAIPFAAARPLQIIPATMIGAAAGAAVAGAFMVENRIWWGGLIVAAVGGTSNPFLYFVAMVIGSCVTAAVAIGLIWVSETRKARRAPALSTAADAGAVSDAPVLVSVPASDAPASAGVAAPAAAPAGVAIAPKASVTDYVSPVTIDLALSASDRDDAIRRLVALAAESGNINDVEDVAASAIAREQQFSTAVGNGIAIPHAKTDGVTRPVIAFARTESGLDWGSPSGDRARLLFLIAVPEAAAGNEHLRILAKLSRALAKQPFREGLEQATNTDEVLTLIREYTGS